MASAAGAVVTSRVFFPFLSINNDEAINRLQADALAHGHLFIPATALPDAFRPWLAAVRGGEYVLKYTPVVPAMMATSQILTGGSSLYLGVIAGLIVVFTYLLAKEVLTDRNEALVATALVALSPLVIVQSALLLSYLPNLLLLEVFAWGLLKGLARGRNGLLALSGLAIGLAFFARSFDALVFAVPVVLGALLIRDRRPSLGNVISFLAPGTVCLVGFFAFNRAATGSALQPPFSLLEPDDAMGFGMRQLYAEDTPSRFGMGEGLSGAAAHAALLNIWVAGGTILLVLALVSVLRRRVRGVAWSFAAFALLLPLSYVFFWGPWNATFLWGGTRYVGPFYFLPLVLPLSLLGARALADLHRRSAGIAIAIAAVMAAFTATSLGVILTDNAGFSRNNQALARLVDGRSPKQLIFASMPTPFLMHPSAVVSNRWDLSGPVVYAIEQGNSDLDAARMLPSHTPFRLRFDAEFHRPNEAMKARLEQLRLASGERLSLHLIIREPALTSGRLALEISAFGMTKVYLLGEGAAHDEALVVGASGADLVGRPPVSVREAPGATGLDVSLVTSTAGPAAPETIARERLPMRAAGTVVEALVPTGSAWTAGRLPAPLLELTG